MRCCAKKRGTTGRSPRAIRETQKYRLIPSPCSTSPVTSHNAALAGALVSFVTKGGIEVTIEGKAVVKFLIVTKPVPFSRTVPVTMVQIAGIVAGQEKQD